MDRPKLVISAGVALALLAGLMAVAQKRKPEPIAAPNTRHVLVAAQPITRGQLVEAELVRVIELPVSAVPKGAYASETEVVGKLARSAIYVDDILTEAKFLDTRATSALSGLIPPGNRAISIKVNEITGIAGFVGPGSHVDVLLTVAKKVAGDDESPARTRTIVQDVEVLAVDQSTQQYNGEPIIADAVTLNVKPRQAEAIAVASLEGPLHLSLRNDKDDSNVWSGGIAMTELVDNSPKAYTGNAVEFIRGIERLEVRF